MQGASENFFDPNSLVTYSNNRKAWMCTEVKKYDNACLYSTSANYTCSVELIRYIQM